MIGRQITALSRAFPNIGRGLAPMLFNAFVFYVLNKRNEHLLPGYTWFLISGYFMITITGWGLRDFMVKEYSQNMHRRSEISTKFFKSKIPLLVVVIPCIIFFFPEVHTVLFLILFVMARTGISLLEPLILVNKRITQAFIGESIVYLLAASVLYFEALSIERLLLVVVGVEVLRFIIAWGLVRPSFRKTGRSKSTFKFLNETKFYFFIALFSFFMSRVDAFILGFYRGDLSFSHYNIILTLIAASQIVIASIYNQNIKSVFKLDILKVRSLLDKITGQFILLSLAATVLIYVLATYLYSMTIPRICFLLIPLNLFCFCLTVKYLFILNHANRPALFLAASIVSSVVNVVLSVLLIPVYGMKGALISNTAAVFILVGYMKYSLAKLDFGDSTG